MKQTCDMGHWICRFDFDPDLYVGFVYLITNLVSGKRYIGRKNLTSTRRKQVKKKTDPTQKKTIRVTKASDWETYTSSSAQLNADINAIGKENFRFEITAAYKTKAELSYGETHAIIMAGALVQYMSNGEPAYYNGICPSCRRVPKR